MGFRCDKANGIGRDSRAVHCKYIQIIRPEIFYGL